MTGQIQTVPIQQIDTWFDRLIEARALSDIFGH
jgi:hypothetical protein